MSISHEQWHEIAGVLEILVRKETSNDEWLEWIDWADDTLTSVKCNICGEIVPYPPRDFSLVQEHGIAHLKERNLLPFI